MLKLDAITVFNHVAPPCICFQREMGGASWWLLEEFLLTSIHVGTVKHTHHAHIYQVQIALQNDINSQ